MSNTKLHHRFKLSSKNYDHNDDGRQFLLNQQENNDSNEEKRKDRSFDKIPWKGITLAFLLTIIGSFIIVVFICSQMGWIEFKPDDNFTFLTLAFITLVPGLYHCMIAFRAFRGYEGYSFDDIADLN